MTQTQDQSGNKAQSSSKSENITPQQAYARAQALFDAGKLAPCENLCRQIIKAQPNFHPAHFQLGLIASQVGKMPLAVQLIEQALQIAPETANYHRAIGEIYRRLGRLGKAVAHGQRAAQLDPENEGVWYNLGIALADSGKQKEAAQAYQKALEYKPDYGLAANNLGTALEKLDDEDGAIKAYNLAIDINPSHAEAHNNLGAVLSARGELDKARSCFSAAIEGNPNFVYAHYNLSSLKKYTKDDPHFLMLEDVAKRAETLPAEERMRYWFAIGKAREDVGRYDEAFDAYKRGNDLKRASFQYDGANIEKMVDDIIARFDKAFFDERKELGCTNETPVFILGMPRSGTTLIEQVFASHGDVFGAGELHDLDQVLEPAREGKADALYMNWLGALDGDALKELGENYVMRIKALGPEGTARISDKMPANFFYVGLIHLILPNAKIIHSMRDPLDVCVSNYSRLFNETMHFAYDLEDLGRYYNAYKRLMKHWESVLPEGTILPWRYEEAVENLEGNARQLIEYCELEWDDKCLEFHKNDRHVKTASIAQVRQPIYKTSLARWKNFEKHLGPLINIIEKQESTS